jgi:ribosomal protein L37E
MLDVSVKVGPDDEHDSTLLKVDMKEYEYPIYFERKNICVSCGTEGDLIFVNIFGKETSHDIYPFEYIKCKRCGAMYSIKWSKGEDNKLYPSAVDKKITRDFLNNFKKKDKKIKELD